MTLNKYPLLHKWQKKDDGGWGPGPGWGPGGPLGPIPPGPGGPGGPGPPICLAVTDKSVME